VVGESELRTSNFEFRRGVQRPGLKGVRGFRAIELPIRRLVERLGKVGHRV